MYKYLKKKAVKKVKPSSEQVVSRTKGNEHQLKHRRIHLNIMKLFFTMTVTEQLHRLPKEVVHSPTLEIFETSLNIIQSALGASA